MKYTSQREKDFYELTFSDYLKKYYIDYDISRWNIYWKNGILIKMFDKTKQENIREDLGLEGHGKYFDFNKMQNFYNHIRDDKRFDDDIKRFFAFLAGDGYFDVLKISYEEFITCTNLNNPIEPSKDPKAISLEELSKLNGGQNYIRMLLLGMGWLKQ